MSTSVTPVAQQCVATPADAVMSWNRMSPVLRYKRLDTWLPAKKMSGLPSLSMSPMPTTRALLLCGRGAAGGRGRGGGEAGNNEEEKKKKEGGEKGGKKKKKFLRHAARLEEGD